MILFFGTRPGKTSTKKLKDVSCPYCHQTNTLSSIETSHFFHFFWIKLFKISSATVAECAHCKRVYEADEFTREMQLAAGK